MAKVTNSGAAALAAAAISNTVIPFTRMLIGDGNGVVPVFSGNEAALVRQVDFVEITSVYRTEDNPNQIRIVAEIPWNQGGYTIREAAAANDLGEIYVIGGYAEIVKPPNNSEHARKLTVVLIAEVSPQIVAAIATFSREAGPGLQPIVIQSGNGFPVGYLRRGPYNGGVFTDGHNHKWLQVGLLHTKAGNDVALMLPGLCSYGGQVKSRTYSAGDTGMPVQAATNGVGRAVVAFSNNTNVYKINGWDNYGGTVQHKLTTSVTAAVYFDGIFVVAANTATGCKFSYSTDDGQSFTAHPTEVNLVGGALVGSVRGAALAGKAIFAVAGSSKIMTVTKVAGGGISVAESALPEAVHAGSPPMVRTHGQRFVIASRTAVNLYVSAPGGGGWTDQQRHQVVSEMEDMVTHEGTLYWVWRGVFNGRRYYELLKAVDDGGSFYFDNWLYPLPEPYKTMIARAVQGDVRLYSVRGGLLVNFSAFNVGHSASFLTTDLINFKLINFALSPAELAGEYAQYFCFDSMVMGGENIKYPLGPQGSGALFVDYANPDYVGVHFDGVSGIEGGMTDYVRIK